MPTFSGENGIAAYRLTVAKHAVLMEAQGIRMSRGRRWSPVMRKEFGLKRNAPASAIVEAIDRKLAEILPQARANGEITP